MFSPDEVHHGTWRHAWARRDAIQQAYYAGHPERFRRPPHTPTPANLVGINIPKHPENAVHSLEHSAVWITYRPDLSAADQAELKNKLTNTPYVLASPYPGLPGPVVASAWGQQVVLNAVTDPRLTQFITQFAGTTKAPEPGGECTGGNGTPN